MNPTFDRLCEILVQQHQLAPDRLAPETPLEDLGTVELLWNVEAAFAVKLPTRPPPLVTLRDVACWIDQLNASQVASPRLRAA